MSLTVYGHPGSQPTRAIMSYLGLLGEKFEFKFIDLPKGEHKSPEYEKINPFKLIPAITEDGFSLAESTAILAYIAQTRKDTKYFPTDPKKAALVNQYFSWHHSNTRPSLGPHFAAVYKKVFPEGYVKVNKEDTILKVEALNKKFEELFLSKNKFITGDEFTVADLLAFCEFQQIWIFCKYDYKNKFPKIFEWFERILAIEGLQGANKPVEEVLGFIDKFRDE